MGGKKIAIGVIPARYQSTRLPGKPLLDLAGQPMILRVVGQVKRASLLSRVLVATDDARIHSVVSQAGIECVMTPADIQTGSDRVFAASQSIDCDIVVNIHGDEPLIDPRQIDLAVSVLREDEKADVSTLVKRIQDKADVLKAAARFVAERRA